jgi:hypothetical protein
MMFLSSLIIGRWGQKVSQERKVGIRVLMDSGCCSKMKLYETPRKSRIP